MLGGVSATDFTLHREESLVGFVAEIRVNIVFHASVDDVG